MKKAYLFLLACGIFSFAQAQTANAVVFSEMGDKFTLYLNGEKQNASPQSNVKVTGLTGEFYQARIDFEDAKLPDFANNNFAVQKGVEVTYIVKTNKKGEYVLRFHSQSELTASTSTPTSSPAVDSDAKRIADVDNETAVEEVETTTTTTKTGDASTTGTGNGTNVGVNMNVGGFNTGMTVQESTTTTTTGKPNTTTTTTTNGQTKTTDNVNVGMNVGGLNMGVNIKVEETTDDNVNMNMNVDGMDMQNADVKTSSSSSSTKTTTTKTGGNTTTTTTTTTSKPAPATQPTKPREEVVIVTSTAAGCSSPMADSNFQSALKSVESKGFDDTRLSTAKTILKSNCMSSEQIKQMCEKFSFEESKLDFAKFAYDRCTDTGNYFVVSEVFSFSSSTDELNTFIESK